CPSGEEPYWRQRHVPRTQCETPRAFSHGGAQSQHIAIIAHPNDPQRPRIASQLEDAARKLQVKLTLHDVGAAEQISDAFSAIVKEGAEGLLVAPHTLFFFNRLLVAESAAKSHLPAIYPYSEAATAIEFHIDVGVTARSGGVR